MAVRLHIPVLQASGGRGLSTEDGYGNAPSTDTGNKGTDLPNSHPTRLRKRRLHATGGKRVSPRKAGNFATGACTRGGGRIQSNTRVSPEAERVRKRYANSGVPNFTANEVQEALDAGFTPEQLIAADLNANKLSLLIRAANKKTIKTPCAKLALKSERALESMLA